MRIIDTDRRSYIPLRIAYLLVTAVILAGSAILLLGKGAWGMLAFFCLNTPFVVVSVYLKDGRLKRFNDGVSDLAEFFRPFN
ncbi:MULTISPECIES: hypothetical protein [Pseudomonas]|uniref:hypothetical protein n=1 Tax=Pseudomonas TaxID=286 RepID=UPI0025A33F1F|nr:hypothetical protein [Pseudomonas asiatica]WJN50039.1 hypothetical protein QUR91_25955 [Pseudomonas asiatica]